MAASQRLLVVIYDQVMGRIQQRSPTADPEFTYDPRYAATGAIPLSTRMPIAETTHRGRDVRAFLEGILPEEPRTRRQWSDRLGVAPDDAIGLLARMGWDCPGAVQFCPI